VQSRVQISDEKHENEPGPTRVTISHVDLGAEEYLVNKVGLPALTCTISEALVAQRPSAEAALDTIIATIKDVQQERNEMATRGDSGPPVPKAEEFSEELVDSTPAAEREAAS